MVQGKFIGFREKLAEAYKRGAASRHDYAASCRLIGENIPLDAHRSIWDDIERGDLAELGLGQRQMTVSSTTFDGLSDAEKMDLLTRPGLNVRIVGEDDAQDQPPAAPEPGTITADDAEALSVNIEKIASGEVKVI